MLYLRHPPGVAVGTWSAEPRLGRRNSQEHQRELRHLTLVVSQERVRLREQRLQMLYHVGPQVPQPPFADCQRLKLLLVDVLPPDIHK